MGQKLLLVPWKAVTLRACTAGWNQDAVGKRNDRSGSERIRRKHCRAPEAALEANKQGLGSAPSPPILPSNTSPSEPKLRSISKANVGTFPFSVLGLLYIRPWVFLIQIWPLRSPLLSLWFGAGSHQKHYTTCIAGRHVFHDSSSHEWGMRNWTWYCISCSCICWISCLESAASARDCFFPTSWQCLLVGLCYVWWWNEAKKKGAHWRQKYVSLDSSVSICVTHSWAGLSEAGMQNPSPQPCWANQRVEARRNSTARANLAQMLLLCCFPSWQWGNLPYSPSHQGVMSPVSPQAPSMGCALGLVKASSMQTRANPSWVGRAEGFSPQHRIGTGGSWGKEWADMQKGILSWMEGWCWTASHWCSRGVVINWWYLQLKWIWVSGESPVIFCSIWHLPHRLHPFFQREAVFSFSSLFLFFFFSKRDSGDGIGNNGTKQKNQ